LPSDGDINVTPFRYDNLARLFMDRLSMDFRVSGFESRVSS
jgi:hypothetical protein